MTYTVEGACACHIGKVRLNNEDNFYFDSKILPPVNSGAAEMLSMRQLLMHPVCFAVFDGMGGEKHGEQAAYIAAKTLAEQLRDCAAAPSELLTASCEIANDRICVRSAECGGDRIGSTAAILYVHGDHLWLCNIGDSRIYRLRDDIFTQRSQDHTDALFGARKQSPMLTQHLGIFPHEMLIEPYLAEEDISAGDRYLICSDGLTDMVADDEIALCLRECDCVKNCVDSLMKRALERGGRDNITVVVCEVKRWDKGGTQ